MRHHQIRHLGHRGFPADQLGDGLRKVGRTTGRSGNAPHGHFSGELVAAPGHGPDEIAVGSQGLAQCRDLGLKAVLLDHPAGPHAAHQLVLCQDRPGGIDERQEHLESAAAELDWLAVCQQLAAMRKEREAAELDEGSGAG